MRGDIQYTAQNSATGWNIIQVRKGQMVSQGNGPNLAAMDSVALVARKLESTNTVLHVADLRVLEADSMCPLVRGPFGQRHAHHKRWTDYRRHDRQ